MKPVDHLDALIMVEPVQCDDPWFEKLDAAYRAVQSSLPRRCHARSPWRADTADEHQACIAWGRGRNRHLGRSDFVFANHMSRLPATRPKVTAPAVAADWSDADHYVGGLDDRGRLHARLQPKLLGGLVGDRRGDRHRR